MSTGVNISSLEKSRNRERWLMNKRGTMIEVVTNYRIYKTEKIVKMRSLLIGERT